MFNVKYAFYLTKNFIFLVNGEGMRIDIAISSKDYTV